MKITLVTLIFSALLASTVAQHGLRPPKGMSRHLKSVPPKKKTKTKAERVPLNNKESTRKVPIEKLKKTVPVQPGKKKKAKLVKNNSASGRRQGNSTRSDAHTMADQVPVWVSIYLDNFPSETGWSITQNGNVLESWPEGSFTEPGWYEELVYLHPGDYTFTMTDSVGDGICCQHGDGFYWIFIDDGLDELTLVDGDGEFGYSTSDYFSVPNPNPPPQEKLIWVDIMLDNWPQETGYYIQDWDGYILIDRLPGTFYESGLFTEALYLVPGEYSITLTDEVGDGIVDGWYSVSYDNGDYETELIREDGDFDWYTSSAFVIPQV